MSVLTELEFPPHLVCLKNIDALLQCPICHDYLNISMMTKCSHNFCSLCIRKSLSYKLQCPVCNLAVTELDLRNNRILDDLVTSFQAARQQSSQSNLGSPSVSPKTLRSNVKRKAPNARRPVVENAIMKNFLQKGNSPSSSCSSLSLTKRPRLKPLRSSKNLTQDPLKLIGPVNVETDMKSGLKEEQVEVPLKVTGAVKNRQVKASALVTRTVKEEKVEIPMPLTMTVKKEKVENPVPRTMTVKEEREMVEEPATVSFEYPSTSQTMKAVVKVECPVCAVGIPEHHINRHLDSCLGRDEKKDSLRSSTHKRKPLTKLVYSLLSVQDLRKRLRALNLPTQGSWDQLVRRHQEYVLLYNAECDSISPKSAQDIAEEVETNEKLRAQLHKKPKRIMVFSKNQTEEEIDKLHSNYRKQHSVEFSRLIDQVKGHWKASTRACVKEEVPEGAGEAERWCPSDADEHVDAASCVLSVSSEDPAQEEGLFQMGPNERSPSPAFSDISVSSSISDVFGTEADGEMKTWPT